MAFTEETHDDRALLTRVLEEMSDDVAGRDPAERSAAADVEQFLPSTEEPDPPMDPDDERLQQDYHHPDDGHDHAEDKPGEHQARRPSGYAWGGHQNGRIPTKALMAIGQGSHRLEVTAAEAWMAMRVAAARDGVTLRLTDSYRSFDQQVAVRRKKGHKVATATPGTSVHGWGKAVDADVDDAETLAWLRANASRFGWVNPAWAQKRGKSYEPWHWEFTGGGR